MLPLPTSVAATRVFMEGCDAPVTLNAHTAGESLWASGVLSLCPVLVLWCMSLPLPLCQPLKGRKGLILTAKI